MSPRPDVWHQATSRDTKNQRPSIGRPEAPALLSLSDEQRQLIDLLQTRRHGMTMGQIEAKLAQSRGGVQALLDSLLERQLVARLNTVVPSYVYRYGGVDLHVE